MRRRILSLLILGALSTLSTAEESPLYEPSDPLVILSRDNFSDKVHGSPTAWIVEFYSSWCGHCIRFAPTFKEFAGKVKNWKDIIQVGVLDCAQENNTGTCRDYDVGGYPTLKFFSPQANDSSKGVERQSYSKTMESLLKDTADYAASQKLLKDSFPRMEAGREVDTAFQRHPQAKVALFLNPDKYKYGASLFLNLRKKLGNSIPLYLSSKNAILASFLLPGEKILRSLSIQGNTLEDDEKVILERLRGMSVVETKEASHPDETRRRYKVFMSDLENALIYVFKQEVSTHAVIAGKQLSALQDFSEVLSKYFPGRTTTRRFLSEMKAWIFAHEDAVKGEELEGHFKALSERLGAFKDTPKGWVGCKGSSKRYGGYPCALWTLFHTLTVSHAGTTSDGVATKHDVLDALRAYVKEFFGCRECAEHFQEEWFRDPPSKSVKLPEDSILWLWRAHNKANVRLSGDPSDDPSYPKKNFPDSIHCPSCSLAGTSFNEPEVLKFLKKLYGPQISFEGLSKESPQPVFPSYEFKKPTREYAWFSSMDFGLLMMFNLGALFLVLLICRKVLFKRKCKLLNGTFLGNSHHSV
eukprot:TRINITY_DN4381_c0_g1_i1.p1 TRINITY_DN4381_c0_g1~~TRINITY_DN4381_c0_g1_i1.p1  ORF type:complete len:583 (+),score=160.69 TRINITY_DN4381_c0_g1_i1:391-2139(+)